MSQSNLPDYGQLIRFLFQPFLTAADALSIDCEYTIDNHRVWVRVAVATADQASAFGRGGRNIQAIRTILQAAATAVGQSLNLDVYGSSSAARQDSSDRYDSQSAGDGASANRPPRTMPTKRAAPGSERPAGEGESAPKPRPRRES